MTLSLVTPPAAEPVTLAQLKLHSRIALDDEDSLIESYIRAARKYAETVQRRQLLTATWLLTLDRFPDAIWLPLPPLQSVESITYLDGNGSQQTLDPARYLVDAYREPGRVVPAYGQTWPAVRCQPNGVQVTFVAGYGDVPASVPETTRQAIRLLAAHYFENRESDSVAPPAAVDWLLACEKFGSYA